MAPESRPPRPAAARSPDRGPAERPRPAAPKHLVVVDDEPVILEILQAVFEGSPWRTTYCSTGQEALEVMRTEGVDLLLTDKNLPDVNGIELLKAARRFNDLAEVIVITGYASLETAITAMELGAFDYVLKPLDNVFEIRRKVQRASEKQDIALENRRLVRELTRKNRELEKALAETRQLQEELIQSEKLAGIGTLAAGVAHEVSSPLFGILGMAEAILDEDDLDVVRDHARQIVTYSQAIRDIVVELSSYSRAATNEYLTTVDLRAVVDDAARLVAHGEGDAEVVVHNRVPEGTTLNARTSEIQQVFVNLLKNAREAMEGTGGEVVVDAREDGRHLQVRVRDDGPGIPRDQLRQVFDPFYTTKPPGKGTGLGLNIVYRIVTRYRGSISVESQEGAGTVFTMRFPLPAREG